MGDFATYLLFLYPGTTRDPRMTTGPLWPSTLKKRVFYSSFNGALEVWISG